MLQLEDKLLIADFMGIEYDSMNEVEASEIIIALNMTMNPCVHFSSPLETVNIDETDFDSSWDWIMPVVKEIREKINVEFSFEQFDNFRYMEQHLNPYNYDVERIAEMCLEFIKRYNHMKENGELITDSIN